MDNSIATLPIVDWVLVELMDHNFGTIERKAALLKSDGEVVDATTGSTLIFCNLDQTETYYVVMRHRNHLDIISTNPIPINNGTINYDFTIVENIMGGEDQLVELSNGIYGILSGDFDGNGTITVSDFILFIQQLSTINQYIQSDANLDGSVTLTDFNLLLPNISKLGVLPIRY